MSERMTIQLFRAHCRSDILSGYQLRPWQEHPENYEELVSFMAERIGLTEEEFSVEALSRWLMDNRQDEESCSPEVDTMHITAVILIGEIRDNDAYVASLPNHRRAVLLPPPEIIRERIDLEAQTDL